MGNKTQITKRKGAQSMIPNDSIDFYPTPDDLADDMIRRSPRGERG